jgi:hypothetical protein
VSESNEDWGLVMSFWIDTDGYNDRDRAMFVAGVEFQMVYALITNGWHGCRPIHQENSSRIRMMCGRLGVGCRIEPHTGYEGCETWADLHIEEGKKA